jgi:hypothetical protein
LAKQYFESGERTGAALSLSFIALTLMLQVALCVIQKFRTLAVMWQEIRYTLILLKLALEVVRILFGETHASFRTFSLLQENGYSKAIEVATEALPAAICQLFFFVRTTDPTALQLASIIVSIVTAAVTVASIDFNLNMDPRTIATEDGHGATLDSSLMGTSQSSACSS